MKQEYPLMTPNRGPHIILLTNLNTFLSKILTSFWGDAAFVSLASSQDVGIETGLWLSGILQFMFNVVIFVSKYFASFVQVC